LLANFDIVSQKIGVLLVIHAKTKKQVQKTEFTGQHEFHAARFFIYKKPRKVETNRGIDVVLLLL